MQSSLQSQQTIIQSPNDKRLYKFYHLNNKMKILLISDKDTDKSSASLDVHVGQLEDPDERQGLAHFLEHMLFMGTKKYHIQNEYSDFLSKHSGYENAYTDLMDTNFYFECSNDALEGALDRFAQFFISPLFDPTCIEKEINAVDSEHQMGITNDEWKIFQVFRSLGKEGNVFRKFGGGNLQTLSKPTIREDLIKFYEEHYSSNIMSLVLYAKMSLEEMEKMVEEKFKDVPNKNLEPRVYKDKPFDSTNLNKFVKIEPMKDEDTLEFVWVLDYLQPYYKKQPQQFLSFFFGHEGQNSLTSLLIDEGLAHEVSSFEEDYMKNISTVGIKISLTEQGLQNVENVVQIVWKYVEILKKQGIQEWIFKEQSKIHQIEFDSKERESISDYTTKLAEKIHIFPIQDILASHYQWLQFDPQLLKEKVFDRLNEDNLIMYLCSQSFEEDELDLFEPFHNTAYSVQEIPEKYRNKNQINLDLKFSKKKLGLPVLNPFIPEKFELVQESENQKQVHPQIIYQNDFSAVWFKKDTQYNVCKGYCVLTLFTNDLNLSQSCEGQIFQSIWTELLSQHLKEINYLAETANLICKFSTDDNAIKIKLKGFDQKFDLFFNSLFDQIIKFQNSEIEQRLFDLFHETELSDYENFFKDSSSGIATFMGKDLIYQEGRFPLVEKIKVLKKFTFKKFNQLRAQWFRKTIFFQWYFYGNFKSDYCLKIARENEDKFLKNGEFKKIQWDQMPRLRLNKIPEKQIYIYEFSLNKEEFNPEEPNSSIWMNFQGEPDSLEERLKMKMLTNILSEPFFNQLRTNEQLGYAVECYESRMRGVLTFNFVILSSVASPMKLAERIEDFIQERKVYMMNLSEQEIMKQKENITNDIGKKQDNMFREAKRLYDEIYFNTKEFDRKQKSIEAIKQINKDQLVELYVKLFLKNEKRVEAHVICTEHEKQQVKDKLDRLSKQNNIIILQDLKQLSQFCKRTNQIHLDYYAIKY